jgi:hypothetical protein
VPQTTGHRALASAMRVCAVTQTWPGWEGTRRRRLRELTARVVDLTARMRWAVVLHGAQPGRRGQGRPSSSAPAPEAKSLVEVRSRVGGRAHDSHRGREVVGGLPP